MFFEFCQDSGYDKILQVLGATPRDFLQVNNKIIKKNIRMILRLHYTYTQNLDALHDHLGTLYPGMRAPSFRCTERPEDKALLLHYYSERPGLEYIVIGIVKVSKVFANLKRQYTWKMNRLPTPIHLCKATDRQLITQLRIFSTLYKHEIGNFYSIYTYPVIATCLSLSVSWTLNHLFNTVTLLAYSFRL